MPAQVQAVGAWPGEGFCAEPVWTLPNEHIPAAWTEVEMPDHPDRLVASPLAELRIDASASLVDKLRSKKHPAQPAPALVVQRLGSP